MESPEDEKKKDSVSTSDFKKEENKNDSVTNEEHKKRIKNL